MKLKDDVPLNKLLEYGFVEDPANCEHPDDHYYWLNNYFIQINKNFRITVSSLDNHIEILCLPEDVMLENTSNLDILYKLFTDNLIEI